MAQTRRLLKLDQQLFKIQIFKTEVFFFVFVFFVLAFFCDVLLQLDLYLFEGWQ